MLTAELEGYAEYAERVRYRDRKSTRLNSSHVEISYAVFCLKKKNYKKIGIVVPVIYIYPKKAHDLDQQLALKKLYYRPEGLYQNTNCFLFKCNGDHQNLHSFPTRRSSD